MIITVYNNNNNDYNNEQINFIDNSVLKGI